MAWSDTRSERVQQWYWRAAGKRLALSDSVEEMLKDSSVQEQREQGETLQSVPLSKETPLIPPLLSLRSKQVPLLPAHLTRDSSSPQQKQRRNRRIAKVRLHVLPQPEAPSRTQEVSSPALYEVNTYSSLLTVERFEEVSQLTIQQPCKAVSGSGKFESGQCDAAVANPHITTSSVVVVILTGDPGPVVVQYVSLQPGLGFTVHLSAPTKRITPFNYALL